MGGYDSGSADQINKDEDEDEEYEENGGNQLLGFMFGNVDNSGDLDVDYLDEDAKEHLSALADKLGSSFTDIDLSEKLPQTPTDTYEQDYNGKAEDAVDYEDFDEQYEGPEIQAASEEDYLLPKKDYLSAEVSLSTLKQVDSVFGDENYDEDEEECEERDALEKKNETSTTVSAVSEGEKSPGHEQPGLFDTENQLEAVEDLREEMTDDLRGPLDDKCSSPLPILCVEDGMVILRFSEIFGIHEPLKKEEKGGPRYFTYKEKYKSMDVSDLVEEDEEAFLKGHANVVSVMKHSEVFQNDDSYVNDNSSEVLKSTSVGRDSPMSVKVAEERKDSCASAEPMEEDLNFNFSTGCKPQLCINIFPLDQQDWEQRIVWDCSEVLASHSEAPFGKETELEPQSSSPELSSKPCEIDHNVLMHNSPVFLESFGSRQPSDSNDLLDSDRTFHPQLLRLESRPEMEDSNQEDALEYNQSDTVKRFRELTLQNRDMMDESWLDNIIWEPQKTITKPKLILDLQDEQMLFEMLDEEDNKHLRLHAGAMILSRCVKPSNGVSFGMQGRKCWTGWQFDISNDKFYINGKTSQQLQSSSNKHMVHSFRIHHSAPALKLQTIKLKLSNKDIANFHRPRALLYPHDNEVAVKVQGKLPTQGPMKILLKSLGGKGSKLHVDAEETVSSVKSKASKKLDFKPTEIVKLFYLGRELEDDKSLVSQDVQPNSLVHLVRTKIHLWPKAQKLPGESKSLRPPGAFKKKSDLSMKDGHAVLIEYCEERPLLLSNVGMGANMCTYYQKSDPGDQGGTLFNANNSLGNILFLEPGDKSPFLGDIRGGCSQTSLETNMYKAPVFSHKVPLTDYLLVRSAKGKLSIRRIDKIAVVGQQEPLMEVMSPVSKNLQTYMVNRMLVYVYREFATGGLHPYISVDELSSQFPNLSDSIIRKKMKDCATLKRGKNGQPCWYMKPDFHIPSENELRKMVTPEHVCIYESMQAGHYRLKHLGITRLTLPASISSPMTQLPDEAIALAAASHIERELLITPWNLSSNFVSSTNQDRGNIERLEITGVGDPSGRGLGFSYVRAAPKAPVAGALVKKKLPTARGGSTVTGTDADLRRLSMEAAREVLLKFNVPDELIAKQTRWHRIAMIRKLSSEQAASGVKVDPTTISKYARGQRMSFLQLQQQTREKCQEIWDRQAQSLSALDDDDDDNVSESEANSDLDSFAGDLENLLDAEEFAEGEEGKNLSKHEKLEGVKGLKMRRRPSQVQEKEENEDEQAEAAELFRLLMDDDEQKKKMKKKKAKAIDVLAPGLRSVGRDIAEERVKKTSGVAKNSYGATQFDGHHTRNEINVKDPTNWQVENSILKRNLSAKEKLIKKNGPLMGELKKVKIVGDNVKMFKEKKSARESFVCGACGQLGHMRTNKNCPKYREDTETHNETTDFEKYSTKTSSLDPSVSSQQKSMKKKLSSKSATKISAVEALDGENSNSKANVLPVKFRCGPADKQSDKLALIATESSDQIVMSDLDTGSRSVSKISKIIISNKGKPEEAQVESTPPHPIRPVVTTERDSAESHRHSIVIKPPAYTDREQVEAHKPSFVIRPPSNKERDRIESQKPLLVIRQQPEKDREQPQKKIIIKRTKEMTDHDQISQEESPRVQFRKTKRIVELGGVHKQQGNQEGFSLRGESSERKAREERRWLEEEERWKYAERRKEERAASRVHEEMRMLEEQERFSEIKRFEDDIRREREEEERQKAKKKKKKKPEVRDDYLDDFRTKRNDRRIPERERSSKRRPAVEPVRYGAEYAPATKRRRGGEVGLANILEQIVDTLRDNNELSFLFLKPVSKKEAPDYADIVQRPMDLSTIRDKIRRMEYKNHDEFRHDVWQIAFNAHVYNDGRNPGIPPLADQLLELCDYLIHDNENSLIEAEAGI